jgi:uncharacterized protein (DUF849 family)
MNEPRMVQVLAERMRERGIKPELEVFDLGMANYAGYLLERGYLEGPLYFIVVLGNVASAQANPLEVGVLLKRCRPGRSCHWPDSVTHSCP